MKPRRKSPDLLFVIFAVLVAILIIIFIVNFWPVIDYVLSGKRT
jgi:hypothetical protein